MDAVELGLVEVPDAVLAFKHLDFPVVVGARGVPRRGEGRGGAGDVEVKLDPVGGRGPELEGPAVLRVAAHAEVVPAVGVVAIELVGVVEVNEAHGLRLALARVALEGRLDDVTRTELGIGRKAQIEDVAVPVSPFDDVAFLGRGLFGLVHQVVFVVEAVKGVAGDLADVFLRSAVIGAGADDPDRLPVDEGRRADPVPEGLGPRVVGRDRRVPVIDGVDGHNLLPAFLDDGLLELVEGADGVSRLAVPSPAFLHDEGNGGMGNRVPRGRSEVNVAIDPEFVGIGSVGEVEFADLVPVDPDAPDPEFLVAIGPVVAVVVNPEDPGVVEVAAIVLGIAGPGRGVEGSARGLRAFASFSSLAAPAARGESQGREGDGE